MPQMIATSEIEYPPGKCWKPGDRFEVEDAHANLLQTLGRAKLPDALLPEGVEFERVAMPDGDAKFLEQSAVADVVAAPRRGTGRPPKPR